MRTYLPVVGLLAATSLGCAWDASMSTDDVASDDTPTATTDAAGADGGLGSMHQPQRVPNEILDAYERAVGPAVDRRATYDELREVLDSFGGVSFSIEGLVLRQELADALGDPLDDRFISFIFDEERFACKNVGHKDPSKLLPLRGDTCQVRPGQTTLAELSRVLGSPEAICGGTASFQVRVLDHPVTYYAVLERSDEFDDILQARVTDLRAFDPSGELFIDLARCDLEQVVDDRVIDFPPFELPRPFTP